MAEIDDETSGTESYISDSADGTLLSDHKLKDTEYHLRSGSPVLIEDVKTVSDNTPTTIGISCLFYTSPSPRDRTRSRMPSSA